LLVIVSHIAIIFTRFDEDAFSGKYYLICEKLAGKDQN